MIRLNFKFSVIILFLFLQKIALSQDSFNKAVEYYQNSDYKESISLLLSHLKSNPNDSKALMMIGANYCMLDDYFNAKKFLIESKNIDSVNYKVYFYLGKVYLFEKFYNTALNYFNKSISLNNTYAQAYNYRAIIKKQLNDFDGSLKDAEEAIKIEPNNDEYYYNKGLALHKKGEFQNAIISYQKAISINRESIYYANIAAIYLEQSKLDLSLSEIEKAIKIEPKQDYLYFKAQVYFAMNKLTEACEILNTYNMHNYYLTKDLLIKFKCVK